MAVWCGGGRSVLRGRELRRTHVVHSERPVHGNHGQRRARVGVVRCRLRDPRPPLAMIAVHRALGMYQVSSAKLTPTEYRPTAAAPDSHPSSSTSCRSRRKPATLLRWTLAENERAARAAALSGRSGVTTLLNPSAKTTSPATVPASEAAAMVPTLAWPLTTNAARTTSIVPADVISYTHLTLPTNREV